MWACVQVLQVSLQPAHTKVKMCETVNMTMISMFILNEWSSAFSTITIMVLHYHRGVKHNVSLQNMIILCRVYCGVTIIAFCTSALVSAVVLDFDNYEMQAGNCMQQSVCHWPISNNQINKTYEVVGEPVERRVRVFSAVLCSSYREIYTALLI